MNKKKDANKKWNNNGVMESSRRWKGVKKSNVKWLGHDGMGDEESDRKMKRSEGRRKGVMRDKKKWWEINRREKEIMENEKM
jgi:hypothetical protein